MSEENLKYFKKYYIGDSNLKCYNVKPFNVDDLDDDKTSNGNTITDNRRTEMKNKLIELEKSGQYHKCCDPNLTEEEILNNPNTNLLYNQLKQQYSFYLVDLDSNNNVERYRLSTIKKDDRWRELTPYIFCKISKYNMKTPTSIKNNEIHFDSSNILDDCPDSYCSSNKRYTHQDIIDNTFNIEPKTVTYDDNRIYSAVLAYDLDTLTKYLSVNNNNINNRIRYNGLDLTLLQIAIINYQNGRNKVLTYLLDLEPDLDLKDNNGNTALHHGVLNEKYDALYLLLTRDNKPNANIKNNEGYTPIMLSIKQTFKDVKFSNYAYMYILHTKGGSGLTNIDNKGNTLVHHLIQFNPNDAINILYYLIDNGVDVNTLNNEGLTPLMLIKKYTSKSSNVSEFYQSNNLELLTKAELNLLTMETIIFNTILKSNTEKYSKFINLSDLSDSEPLILQFNKLSDSYICNDINKTGNITGTELKNECNDLGGSYEKKKSSLSVKFEIPDDNEEELYSLDILQNRESSTPDNNLNKLIEEINKEARHKYIETTTEDDHIGDYMTRDIDFQSDENFMNSSKSYNYIDKLNLTNNNSNMTESFINDDKIQDLNTTVNLIEGFDNSNISIKYNKMISYLYLFLILIIVCLVIFISYKLTHL